jgi:oxygen-dependent protoporphyrinogen oxidase
VPHTVVIGAGVSGLATAYLLRRRTGNRAAVTVLEQAGQVGGKVRTVDLAGLPVDTGPDAFLARSVALRALIDELGLGSRVVEPLPGGAYVWSRGRLRPLPPGAAFGLPERLWPLLRSGLLSPAGGARAGLDLVLPARNGSHDPSVRDLVRPRFGSQVYTRLVEPLVGGVHAGDPALLSARSAVPEIAAMAGHGRSLYLAMRGRRRAAPAGPGKRPAPLVSLRGGMSGLTDTLADSLGAQTITTGVRVGPIERSRGGLLTVPTDRGALTATDVVLATPAHAAAEILHPLSSTAAGLLREIPYVDVANVTLAFRREDLRALPVGTGFLVPPTESELIVGCTWLTSKWPHLVNADTVLIKAMVGRHGDDRWVAMSDEELTAGVRDGLARILGIDAHPVDTLVQRWPRSMPQYVVGHAARLERLDAELAGLGRVHLTGAAYRGVGLAGCATQAEATAARIVEGASA